MENGLKSPSDQRFNCGEVSQIAAMAVGRQVRRSHVVPQCLQPSDQRGPKKALTAGDQNPAKVASKTGPRCTTNIPCPFTTPDWAA